MLRILFGLILNTFNVKKSPLFSHSIHITCICELVKMWTNISGFILSFVHKHFFISFFLKFCIYAFALVSLTPENSDNGYATA